MLVTKPYNRDRAVEYARRWALSRNPLFINFAGIGGDCTNFVSQCVLAGSCTMNFTRDFGWYYISSSDRAPAWAGVEYFYDFMTVKPEFAMENGGTGPFAEQVRRRFSMIGDVIQLGDENGDYYHTLLISKIEENEIFVCAHTNDALDRPLSSYNYSVERFLHINGVRERVPDDSCFGALINGTALPVIPPKSDESIGEDNPDNSD